MGELLYWVYCGHMRHCALALGLLLDLYQTAAILELDHLAWEVQERIQLALSMDSIHTMLVSVHNRVIAPGGEKLQMVLNSCAAEGATYALSYVQLADAAKVNAVLKAMHAAAASNLGGLALKVSPLVVPGMAPHALTQRWAVQGKMADSNVLQQQFAVFARGSRVYQATVVGKTLDATAADTFFGGLQLTP